MKKIILFLMLISTLMFSDMYQKTNVKEFDELDLSKGEIVNYYAEDWSVVDSKEKASFYRKVYETKGDLNLIVDFFDDDKVQFIGYVKDINDTKGETFNGTLFWFEKSGVMHEKTMVDGKENGHWRIYSPDGVKRVEITLKDGEPIGQIITYDEQGNVFSKHDVKEEEK